MDSKSLKVPKQRMRGIINHHAVGAPHSCTPYHSPPLTDPMGATQVESEPAEPLKSAAPPPVPKAQPVPAPASKEQGVDFGSLFKSALDSPATPPKVHNILLSDAAAAMPHMHAHWYCQIARPACDMAVPNEPGHGRLGIQET